MRSQTCQQIITIKILSSISRNKINQTKKFAQLIEHNIRNNFLEKSYTECCGEVSTRLSLDQ